MEPQLRSSDAGYNFIGTIKNDTKETLEGSFKISSGYWSTEPKFPIKPYDTMDFAAHGKPSETKGASGTITIKYDGQSCTLDFDCNYHGKNKSEIDNGIKDLAVTQSPDKVPQDVHPVKVNYTVKRK